MEKMMAGILFFEMPASCAQLITLQVCIPPNTLERLLEGFTLQNNALQTHMSTQ